MQPWLDHFPCYQDLTASLRAALSSHGLVSARITVLDRRPMPCASSSPSEVVTCRVNGGEPLRLYCKYSARHGNTAHGHRGDRVYEAMVYQDVLQPLQMFTPAFYGAYPNPICNEVLLLLEDLSPCSRMNQSSEPKAMHLAAQWIGRFHAVNQERLGEIGPTVHRYDTNYYQGWAERTVELSAPLHQRYPWLQLLCDNYMKLIELLLAAPQTVIHGEYYPDNILVRDGTVCPVDWESAAVAAGEIDLASLTDGWPRGLARAYEHEYRRTRWPKGGTQGFEKRLDVARMYLQLRWLGDRPEWTRAETLAWRFQTLRVLGRKHSLV
jgi:hypothetical protein